MSRDRDETGGEGFGGRWSRLKREARTSPAEAPEPPAETRAAPPAEDERSDAEILKELDLPDPDTLKAGDDFKAFLTQAVPARIRNRALRRLWTSNPVLANLDRLVDYDHDYTDAALVPQFLGTGYKVGRGWLEDPKEEQEDEKASEGESAPEESAPEESAPEESAPEESVQDEAAEDEARAATTGADALCEDASAPEPAAPKPVEETEAASARAARAARAGVAPRRMRFRFTDE